MKVQLCRLPAVILLALFLSACGGSNVSHAPPTINRELLVGKWQATESEQVIQSYEFAADKSIQVRFWNQAEPLKGTYAWTGDNTIAVEYQLPGETKIAYQELLGKFRNHIVDRAKKSGGQHVEQIAKSSEQYTDELLDKQNYRVGLSEGASPVLVLFTDKGMQFQFKKAK